MVRTSSIILINIEDLYFLVSVAELVAINKYTWRGVIKLTLQGGGTLYVAVQGEGVDTLVPFARTGLVFLG